MSTPTPSTATARARTPRALAPNARLSNARDAACLALGAAFVLHCGEPTNTQPDGERPDGAVPDSRPLGDGAATRPRDGGVAAQNPCGAVTAAGRCASERELQYCSIPTGRGDPALVTETCQDGESCQVTPRGAACVQTAECLAGETECAADGQLRTCTGGRWVASPCATRCVAGVAGAACAPAATTRMAQGRFRFDVRRPREDLSDWAAPQLEANEGLVVLSQRGDMVLGSAVTDTEGRFTITVPTEPTDQDRLVIAAADFRGGNIVVAVANPNYMPSMMDRSVDTAVPSGSRVWSWSWDLPMLPSDAPYDLTVTAADGAGAAEAFTWLRQTYRNARRIHTGLTGHSFVAWVGLGVSWSCGACYNSNNYTIGRTRFASQMWLDGSAQNEGYWSSAVTVHEAGHWWMDAFGTDPGEGGEHTLGVETFPGQAWSEGFASFVAGDVRNDPLYVDKQGGAMFWFDMNRAERRNAGAATEPLLRPNADAEEGTHQFLDENYVSAILWRLRGTDAAPLYTALATPRATVRPLGGCYNRHQWDGVGSNATNVCDTGESAPMIADFLDALNCSSFDRGRLRAAIDAYPYDVNAPHCMAGVQPTECYGYGYPACRREEVRAPLAVALEPRDPAAPSPVNGVVRLRARFDQRGPLRGPIAVELALPAGVTRTNGPVNFTVTPGRPGTVHVVDVDLATAGVPQTDVVLRARVRDGDRFGLNAAVPYRFGRPVALPAPVPAAARTLRVGRHDLGAPVPMTRRAAAVVTVAGGAQGATHAR